MEEVHVPPLVVVVSAEVLPAHTLSTPPIDDGAGFTVTVAIAEQPVEPIVYDMLAVPAVPPPIKPGASIVAIDGALLVQVPPGVALLSVVVPPTHRPREPVSAAGAGLTVSVRVT